NNGIGWSGTDLSGGLGKDPISLCPNNDCNPDPPKFRVTPTPVVPEKCNSNDPSRNCNEQ
ncbi:MAG: hypothetical protein ACYCOU_24705, partial [Sulfobacillus sp.]